MSPGPIDRILGVIVPPVVGAVPVSEVIDQVNVDQVMSEVDVDAVLDRVDVDAVIKRVDVDAVIERVDVDAVIGRVDVDAVIQRVDVQGVVARVDLDEVLGKVDMDALLARVDIEALLDRVDANALVQRIDVDALMQRVDLDALLDRVDIETLMTRANIDSIVRDASRGMFARSIDLVRRQVVGLDSILIGVVTRLFRRPPIHRELTDDTMSGHRAGGISRLAAFLIDGAVLSVSFALTTALIASLVNLFLGEQTDRNAPGLLFFGGYAGFAFVYYWLGLTITGRSVGKAIVGLKVIANNGHPITPGRAAVRQFIYPFSFILGLGLIPIVFGKNRTALHDWAGRDKVVYDWGDRPAELPAPLTAFVRRHAQVDAAPAGANATAAPSSDGTTPPTS